MSYLPRNHTEVKNSSVIHKFLFNERLKFISETCLHLPSSIKSAAIVTQSTGNGDLSNFSFVPSCNSASQPLHSPILGYTGSGIQCLQIFLGSTLKLIFHSSHNSHSFDTIPSFYSFHIFLILQIFHINLVQSPRTISTHKYQRCHIRKKYGQRNRNSPQ